MKICVIGTGYVGLVAGTCLAEMGNDVICVDNDVQKLEQLKNGNIPIYEPGLEEMIKNNIQAKRLSFTPNIGLAVKQSLICFIAVGTPQEEDGSADLKYVEQVATSIAKSMNNYKIIVNKSTVPVGTGEKLRELISGLTSKKFDIVSNPEFLKQGAAVEDFLRPDRIILGVESENAKNIMLDLYSPLVRNQNPILTMDIKSAEMVKYASNVFLAMKISYINKIANLCENVNADINQVRIGMSSDSRIGTKFLYPGIGFGGSCFPKDIKALINIMDENEIDSEFISQIEKINYEQKTRFIERILNRFDNSIKGKTFAIWGLAFKPKTNDVREAPAINIINELLNLGATINAYDPKAMDNARTIFKDKIKYADSYYETLENADAVILLTEWNEFRRPDFERIKETLKTPIIFDGRNQYNEEYLKEIGFEYYQIGRRNEENRVNGVNGINLDSKRGKVCAQD